MTHGKQVGWSALTAAALVGLALLWSSSWLVALAGLLTIATLLYARRLHAERAALAAIAGALMLWALSNLLPTPLRWGSGLVAMALLLAAALMALLEGEPQRGNRAFRQLSLAATLLAYGSAQLTMFRLQEGDLWLLMMERGAVALLGLAIFFLVRRALARQRQPLVRRLALSSTLLYVFYLALLLSPLEETIQTTNSDLLLLASVSLWASLVALLIAASWLPNKARVENRPSKRPLPGWRSTLNDYLTLMKYRVASLLLLTTLGAMVVAARGWPGWALVGWVMLGGLFSVGGAGALNHYLDRDIDADMGRTSLRPLPAGRIAPWKALLFGLVLSVLQFLLFWFKVNPLAAWLSTGGLLYYVIIYTIWLKRTSTQNIVIGGAA
ncbi:MAG: protoheme IX farnesyltransferase, partial [Ardenticatenaceae bacterium]